MIQVVSQFVSYSAMCKPRMYVSNEYLIVGTISCVYYIYCNSDRYCWPNGEAFRVDL